MFINKNCIIKDLKEKIFKDFGFELSQQKLYFKYKVLWETQFILEIPDFDSEEDIILCITLDSPQVKRDVILREPIDDIKIADVKLLNSLDKGKENTN